MGRRVQPEWGAGQRDRPLLHRAVQVDEIADVIMFLTSPESSYITGTVVAADGGRTRCLKLRPRGSTRGAVDFIPIAQHYYNLADFVIIAATPLFLLAVGWPGGHAPRSKRREPGRAATRTGTGEDVDGRSTATGWPDRRPPVSRDAVPPLSRKANARKIGIAAGHAASGWMMSMA
jgi:hypothetical protein